MNKDYSEKSNLISNINKSLDEKNFVKFTLGKYRGNEDELENIYITLVKLKEDLMLSFRYKYKTKDVFKNYNIDEGVQLISSHLSRDFLYGSLYTTAHDYVLEYSKKRVPRFFVKKPTFTRTEITEHNKVKPRFIDSASKYLRLLGITNLKGEIHSDKYDKFRQIDKFIEIVDSLYKESAIQGKDNIKILDLGSGKSYLTFALYDYFTNQAGIKANITGVELRDELVDLSNKTAEECIFVNLHFVKGNITDLPYGDADIVTALHACDTATDDAIIKSLEANAEIIILAPCCQKYVRRQMTVPENLKGIFRHGILEERLAVSITDGLRALYLESKNYNTKVFEFISTEHTARNTMITAVKKQSNNADNPDSEIKTEEINKIKKGFGLKDFYLDKN